MSHSRPNLRRSAHGFAYLWVLLVVAFMGLGLTAAVEVDSTISRRSKERELLAIGHQFRNAIATYYESQLVAGKREYPASLDDLLRDSRFPGMRRHLRKVFVDPMTGKDEWGLLRVNGRIAGVYSLSEQQPIKQAKFEPEDALFDGKSKYSDWVFAYPPDIVVRGAQPADGAASAPAPAARAASSTFGPVFR